MVLDLAYTVSTFSSHSNMKLKKTMHGIWQPCWCPKYISKGKVSLGAHFCLEAIYQITVHNGHRTSLTAASFQVQYMILNQETQ